MFICCCCYGKEIGIFLFGIYRNKCFIRLIFAVVAILFARLSQCVCVLRLKLVGCNIYLEVGVSTKLLIIFPLKTCHSFVVVVNNSTFPMLLRFSFISWILFAQQMSAAPTFILFFPHIFVSPPFIHWPFALQ